MSITTAEALGFTFAMGGIIFFCRLFPFLFFREKDAGPGGAEQRGRTRRQVFLDFVEKLVPPAAMTVLAFNALAGSFKTGFREGIAVLAASALTALIHLRKRNPLFSISGGIAVYMVLEKFLPW